MSQSQHILIVSDAWHPQVNGVVRTYEYLQETLQQNGHKISIIGPADFPYTLALPGYPEIRLVLCPYKRLSQKIANLDFNSIHIATEGPLGWAARQYCLKHDIPFTTCYHTQFPEYSAKRAANLHHRFYPLVEKLAYAIVRKFHASSKALLVTTSSMRNLLQNKGFSAPIVLMTRGVNTDLFHPADKTLFQELPRPIALYVGRLATEKNMDAFLSMPWTGSKVVVGHGPEEERLKSQYPEAVFCGKQQGKSLAAHYQSADIFVFPSRTDTFGMVITEALACGLPVAAYPVTGPIDILTQSDLGCMNEDLGKAAITALTTGTAATRYAFIRSHYSWQTAAEQFLQAQNSAVYNKSVKIA